uniref:C-type lectin domain-containing protein n=1 Tax=Monopterus albus TaxID=43700 RepID=A0A3Q3K9G9_MONAL
MRKICIVVPLLLLLPLVCGQVAGLRPANYAFYTGRHMRPWQAAQSFCREYHTDLLTIKSEEENQNLAGTKGWIGLYRQNSAGPWKWSRGDEIATFTSWVSNEQDSNKNCVFKNKNKEWEAMNCNEKHSFLCYDETLVLVKENKTWEEALNDCTVCYDETLILVKENKTWEEALNHCRSLEAVDPSKPATAYQNHRYDLVTLVTQDDYNYTLEKAKEATSDQIWTGMRYLAGQWVWVGGERVEYTSIQRCPAETSCGVLLVKNSNALFQISDCEQRINFFCYRKFTTSSGN